MRIRSYRFEPLILSGTLLAFVLASALVYGVMHSATDTRAAATVVSALVLLLAIVLLFVSPIGASHRDDGSQSRRGQKSG